jgi:hypothetical protein
LRSSSDAGGVRRIAAADRRAGRDAANFGHRNARCARHVVDVARNGGPGTRAIMLSRLLSALGLVLGVVVSISPALGACGKGKIPTYTDIQTIWYERSNCFGTCPSYQVLFSKNGDCYYVGYKYVSTVGTYGQTCSPDALKRATTVLLEHHFYRLNYDSSILVTDVPHYIVAAEACGVTSKLDWPAFQDRRDIESLFDSLDVITKRIRWHKISSSTAPMEQWLSLP